jgi:hypothetical protein
MTVPTTRPLTIDVQWDTEAQVWIAECRELPLFTEADTLDALKAKVPVMAADLLLDDDHSTFAFDVSLVVRYGETVDVAA